jgi:hypothetical protein
MIWPEIKPGTSSGRTPANVRSIQRAIEICDFVSFHAVQPHSRENFASLQKASSQLKYEIGQIESAELRVFKDNKGENFQETQNAKFLVWEAAKRSFPWPIFDTLRRSGIKKDVDEASFNLSKLYGDVRADISADADDAEGGDSGARNPNWFDGIRLSREGVREIYSQFDQGKTVYAAAKHMGISYRAASLRQEKWKRQRTLAKNRTAQPSPHPPESDQTPERRRPPVFRAAAGGTPIPYKSIYRRISLYPPLGRGEGKLLRRHRLRASEIDADQL